MPIITAITSQAKSIDRVNLFVDGSFFSGIAKILVGTNRLKVGQEISINELQDLILQSDKERAFVYAMDYISKYTATQKQLQNKLYEKGYHSVVVNYVIEKAKKYGYINDFDYAKCYVEYNKKMKGAVRLKAELRNKGIAQEIISQVLEETSFDKEGALNLAKKHSRNKDLNDKNYIAKLNRYLAYRGFEWSEISECVQKLRNEED